MKINISTIFCICFLSVVGVTHANSLDELANQVSPLGTEKNKTLMPARVTTNVEESQLSQYAYQVGLDVSKLSEEEIGTIASFYRNEPTDYFCDEHGTSSSHSHSFDPLQLQDDFEF